MPSFSLSSAFPPSPMTCWGRASHGGKCPSMHCSGIHSSWRQRHTLSACISSTVLISRSVFLFLYDIFTSFRRFAHLMVKKDVGCPETKKDLLRKVKSAISSTAERFSGNMQNVRYLKDLKRNCITLSFFVRHCYFLCLKCHLFDLCVFCWLHFCISKWSSGCSWVPEPVFGPVKRWRGENEQELDKWSCCILVFVCWVWEQPRNNIINNQDRAWWGGRCHAHLHLPCGCQHGVWSAAHHHLQMVRPSLSSNNHIVFCFCFVTVDESRK